jgi:hypothetical protein
MKRKWLIFALLPLLMLTLVPTILAEPAQKVTVTAQTFNQVNGEPEKDWTTDGGIVHTVYVRTGDVKLTIDGQAPIIGTFSETEHLTVNTKTGESVIQSYDVWTFAGGSFEGIKQNRIETSGPTTIISLEQHAVFQGSGVYEGSTLMLSQEAPPFPPIYTGTMLVH